MARRKCTLQEILAIKIVVELVRCLLFIAVAIVVVRLPHMQVQLKIWAGLNGLNSLVSFIASIVEFSKVATSSVLEWFGIIFAIGFWIYGATIVIIQEKHKEDHLPSRWWLMTVMIAVDIIFTLVHYNLSLKANKEAYLSDDEEVFL